MPHPKLDTIIHGATMAADCAVLDKPGSVPADDTRTAVEAAIRWGLATGLLSVPLMPWEVDLKFAVGLPITVKAAEAEGGPVVPSERRPAPATPSPGLVRHDAPQTARDAALRAAPASGTQRARVLERIVHVPSTDEEIQEALGMSANTERPRRVELVRGGHVKDSGRTRTTAAGHDSIVWEAV